MPSSEILKRVAVVVALAVFAAGQVQAQESESAPLAAELAELLTAADLEAIAARDTADEDRFVAALSFPGTLLIVSARYEVPLYVEQKIADGEYREVYIDLNAASIPQTKVLITDTGADGLSSGDDSADMVDTGSGPARYDGDADAEAQYARMLRALIAEAR
ncbi:MAG: hypothetical protein OXG72_21935 [Acidobacteria bacterium]|nr:hypothetical protein [Acidobacteriota bacterium]